MSNNLRRALGERRPAPPCRLSLGLAPPGRLPPLPPAEPVGGVPFLLYPAPAEPPYYDAYAGVLPYAPLAGLRADYPFEPAFIQKRNERERQRVRCVNEGYARLRGHLPGALAERRLSKVETLRAAIRYIKHLQELLGAPDGAATPGPPAPPRGAPSPQAPPRPAWSPRNPVPEGLDSSPAGSRGAGR